MIDYFEEETSYLDEDDSIENFDLHTFGLEFDEYKERCLDQIANKHINNGRNFFLIAMRKLNFILNPNYLIDESEKNDVKDIKDNFLIDIKFALENELNITIDEKLIDLESSITEIYSLIIVNYSDTVSNMLMEHILTNENKYLKVLGDDKITKEAIKYYNDIRAKLTTNMYSLVMTIVENEIFEGNELYSKLGISNYVLSGLYFSLEGTHYNLFRPIIENEAGTSNIILNLQSILVGIMNRGE